MRLSAVVSVLLAAGAVLAACGADDPAPPTPSPAEVMDRIAEAGTRDGSVLHVTGRTVDEDTGTRSENNIWVDYASERARLVSSYQAADADASTEGRPIILQAGRVFEGPEVEGMASHSYSYGPCLGTGGNVLAEFVACSGAGFMGIEHPETTLAVDTTSEFDGEPATRLSLAVPFDPADPGAKGKTNVRFDIFAARDTYELLGLSITAVDDSDVTSTFRYTSEFIPRDGLPDDFFDVASIGYEARAPECYAITSDTTPRELLDCVEQALTREGEVFHYKVRLGYQDRDDGYIDTEGWVDFGTDEARIVTELRNHDLDTGEGFITAVVQGDMIWYQGVEYVDGGSVEAGGCFGTGADLIIESLPCYGLLTDALVGDVSVEPDADFGGIQVIALTINGTIDEGPGPVSEWKFLIDAHSLVPWAIVVNREGSNQGEPSRQTTIYETEFISRTSFPDNFFDPVSIGFGPATALYADDKESPLQEIALSDALTRFEAAAGFKPILFDSRSMQPLTIAEMRASAAPPDGPGDMGWSVIVYEPRNYPGAPNVRIEMTIVLVDGGVDFGLPESAEGFQSGVTFYYGLGAELGRSSDDYAFEWEGHGYNVRLTGADRRDAEYVVMMLDRAISSSSSE